MRLGLACESFPGAEDEPPERTLELALEAGFEVVQFLNPHAVSRSLAPSEMRATRRAADELELALEMAIGHFDVQGERVSEAVVRRFEACLEAGCREVSAFTLLDRLDPARPMGAQLEGVARACAALAPWLREHEARLNIETHEDVTSHEIRRLVERVGDDVLGVTLDVANFAVRAEEPLAATARVAPYVRQTHLEDVRLHFVPGGVRRTTVACGSGVLDWSAILDILAGRAPGTALCLEQHRGQYDADIFRPEWVAAHPDLTTAELAAFVASTAVDVDARGGEILDRGGWPPPVGPVERRRADLAASAAHLRGVLVAR